MNLQSLLASFVSDNPRLFQIADRISMSDPQHLYCSNLRGSAPAFLISSVFQHKAFEGWNHLVIAEDAESAAYLHNTIENLTRAYDLFYFPSSFRNRKNFSLLNSSHIMLRTETLTKLSSGGNKKLLVSYPEALFEKVVLPGTLSGNIIHIRNNDVLDVDGLMEKMVGYGFERADFVYEPGQFALRGGILDIYSFGNEKPYRVELFGNEVDSIRIFDPETQLSERKIIQVSIIPNVETQFSDENKISLIDFLPANTMVWIQDWSLTMERLLTQEEDLELFLGNGTTAVSDEPVLQKAKLSLADFLTARELETQLVDRHTLEYGHQATWPESSEIDFHTKEQPAFNRRFDFLIRDLKEWERKGFGLYLFADNPRQLERMHSIFEDLKVEINFTPIPISIHEGFIDEDVKVVCYTDHQIFQRYHKYRVKQAYNKNKALTLRTLRELQPGDYVTHIDHGVGVYSGLQKIEVKWQTAGGGPHHL